MSDTSVRPENLQVGAQLPALSFGPITSEHLVRWVAASEDFHAIHYDKDYAIRQGLPGVVMQGPFKLALVECQLLDLFGEKGRLISLSCTYRATDTLGTRLTFQPKIAEIDFANNEHRVTIDVRVQNEKGALTVEGKAVMAVKQ